MMTAEEKAAWLSERAGKLTASRMADAMAYLKSGQPAEARTRLMHELLAERLTGDSVRHFVTDAMQRGLDYEDEMFDAFVEMTGRTIHRSKFYEHPSIEYFGATPDREIDDDGLLEGKVPLVTTFVRWKLNGVVPQEHRPQMLAQLAVTGRKWVGFTAYCPEMKEERHRFFLAKFEPKPHEIEEVEDEARKFLAELSAKFDAFVGA